MGATHVLKGFLFAVVLSAAATTFADTLSGSGGASFQSWLPADLNQDGTPYWDNPSSDGDKRNIGYYLVNAPTAPLAGARGALSFWGIAGGSADLSFYFQRAAASSTVNLELEIAGNSDINEFGWYDITDDPPVLQPLFVGSNSAPATNAFFPSANYGFYLKSPGKGTYYTQSSLNSDVSDRTHQHFVVFRESGSPEPEIYWIGIEDLSVASLNGRERSVGDYNDMLVRLSAPLPSSTIPEPSTVLMVLAGIAINLSFFRRR